MGPIPRCIRPWASVAILSLALGWAAAGPALAQPAPCTSTLTGAQEVPPTTSPATGTGTVQLNAAETQITVTLSFSGLTSAQTAAHIHGPARIGENAPILIPLPNGQISNQTFAVTPAQVSDLRAGLLYFNVHTTNFLNGEIRGQIACQVPPPVIPELSTVLMFGTGLAGLGGYALTRARTARARRR